MNWLKEKLRMQMPDESPIDLDRHAEVIAEQISEFRDGPIILDEAAGKKFREIIEKPEIDMRRVILLATVGSTAHGLALEGTDDRDEMGVLIEPPEYVIGLKHFEQKIVRSKPQGVRSEHGDLDQVLYSCRKFCRLALSGNPSILVPLFAPCDILTELGEELRANAHWFAARSAGKAFLGYMTQQRQRLLGERGQMNVKRPELTEKYGYDTKYAMHMLRLGFQGVEFLETGKLTLPMPDEPREFLQCVRCGEVELNDALTQAGKLEQQVSDLIDTSPLDPHPNHDAVNAWLVHAYERKWGFHV